MNLREIYCKAESIADPAARRCFLDEACGGDKGLRAEVDLLLGLPTIPPDQLPDPAAILRWLPDRGDAGTDPWIGSTVGGVRIERFLDEGGMSRVYAGVESGTGGTVALKMLRQAIASEESLRRFEQEGRLLARLRHPGIAQIHSAGRIECHGLSIPYFIMEYIPDAEHITEFATARNLNTMQRLDLFRRVCEAVAHGHEHGVIHRDLKPANILVDAHGQPKVIDFGVAKCTDADALPSTVAAMGTIAGTPAYMSPEQHDGAPDAITVRCDVHALGVVLYELLAGRMPFDFSRAEQIGYAEIIRSQEPTPLSSVSRVYRGDLDAIVSKCLEKDRHHRFSGAADLGAEIGRYLAGEAILTRPPGFFGGIVRLARRHRAAAAATFGVAASLVAAVVGISIFAYRAEGARKIADEQRDAAEGARNLARRSRDAAENLVGFMTIDLRDKLEPIGRLDLMEDVLEKIHEYHLERDRLEEAGEEDVTATDLRVRATSLDTTGDLEAALGHLEAARRSHERGLEARERALRKDPGNAEARFDLTYSLLRLADVAMRRGDRPAARGHLTRFRGIVDELLAEDRGQRGLVYSSSVCESKLGDLAATEGDLASARLHFERETADLVTLLATDVVNPTVRRGLSAVHLRLGDLAMTGGDLVAAGEHHAVALTLAESLAAEDPRDVQRQRDVTVFHDRLGEIAAAQGDRAAAAEHFRRSLEVRERLVAHDPRNAAWQRALSASHARLGDLALAGGDTGEAESHIERLLAIRETLAAADPGNAARQLDLAVAHDRAGALALAVDDTEASLEHFERAFSIGLDLVARDPANADWARALVSFANRRGDVALDRLDPASAADSFVTTMAALDRAFPDSRAPGVRRVRLTVLESLAECHRRLGDAAAAEACEARIAAIGDGD